MANLYDGYVWRLYSLAPQPIYSITLPKDLLWSDEFNWTQVGQVVEYSTEGALLIQESVKQKGRPITLTGLDNMAWVTREQVLTLSSMQSIAGLIMKLDFCSASNFDVKLISMNVMFRQSETPFEIKPIKQWDQFETGAWMIIQNIKLMETLAYGA